MTMFECFYLYQVTGVREGTGGEGHGHHPSRNKCERHGQPSPKVINANTSAGGSREC